MRLRSNDCYRAAARVLRDAGIPFSVAMGSRHLRIDYYVGGRRCRGTVPTSTSDVRSAKNTARNVKANLRQFGG